MTMFSFINYDKITVKVVIVLKKMINFFNKEYYLKFILYMLAFGLVSVLFFLLDQSLRDSWYADKFSFSQTFLEDFLMMMLASIITMVTITFSIIMVVLTLYSGQFSPRTLNDFLQRKVPLNILGYFIGVIVYALVSLVVTENQPLMAFPTLTMLAVIMFVLGIGLFAFFIHYVSKSVQVNYFIDNMVKEAINDIEKYQKTIDEDHRILLERDEKAEKRQFDYQYKTDRSGYLIDINKKKLLNYLEEHDIYISVAIPINEHIYEDDVLFKYSTHQKNEEIDKEIINECFLISDEVGQYSEYRNKTMKLTEIAVRALSPGTNDPATAISCINQLGYVFMKLSDAHYSLHYQDSQNTERLLFKTINYDDLLYDHFYQIYLYGKQDLMIRSAILKAFTRMAKESNRDMKESLWHFAIYILEDIELRNMDRLDLRKVAIQLRNLSYLCHTHDQYKQLVGKDDPDE